MTQSPGWYSDAADPETEVWWDGDKWTLCRPTPAARRRPAAIKTAEDPEAGLDPQAWMITLGWACAFLFPVGGLIVAAFAPARFNGHRVAIALTSTVLILVGLMIVGGAL